MKAEDKSKLVEVFGGSPWEADLVKSMLGDNGVECVVKNMNAANVLAPVYLNVDVVLSVLPDDAEAARQVVAEFEKNRGNGD